MHSLNRLLFGDILFIRFTTFLNMLHSFVFQFSHFVLPTHRTHLCGFWNHSEHTWFMYLYISTNQSDRINYSCNKRDEPVHRTDNLHTIPNLLFGDFIKISTYISLNMDEEFRVSSRNGTKININVFTGSWLWIIIFVNGIQHYNKSRSFI